LWISNSFLTGHNNCWKRSKKSPWSNLLLILNKFSFLHLLEDLTFRWLVKIVLLIKNKNLNRILRIIHYIKMFLKDRCMMDHSTRWSKIKPMKLMLFILLLISGDQMKLINNQWINFLQNKKNKKKQEIKKWV